MGVTISGVFTLSDMEVDLWDEADVWKRWIAKIFDPYYNFLPVVVLRLF